MRPPARRAAYRLAIDRSYDGAFIGCIGLNQWNPTFRSASMGYCFEEPARAHGYATEAATAVLEWAYDALDLSSVQAETDTRNLASARVLEKLGFLHGDPPRGPHRRWRRVGLVGVRAAEAGLAGVGELAHARQR